MYIGIDVHKNSCYITAMDEAGNILEEKEIETEHMIEWMNTIDTNSMIAMESSTASKPPLSSHERTQTKCFNGTSSWTSSYRRKHTKN
jgi:hypothetical protein